jgi:hypothetical protein
MQHHSPGIVWKKGLSKQDYYTWCHIECFPLMAEKVNDWIKRHPKLIEKININQLSKMI